ncbi:MAG: mannose-6-phosphate isomerase, class I [Acutalibacteraceae bacterium]
MKILKLRPAVKDYIWGGTRLAKEFDIESGFDKQAEAWVLSCHDDGENIIQGGQFDGRTLKDVLENEGKDFLGTNCEKFDFFPILIKLIDAKDDLSVQVHPSDEYALEHENQYGKTEAWYIIDCDEGAQIIYGLNHDMTKEQLKESIENSTLLENVNRINVKKGDIYFIPSGTIHAICKGVLLAEIQQNSNVTYRVYDYNRLQNGKPRELHIEKAVDVINLKAADCSGEAEGEKQKFPGYSKTLLKKCDLFTVNKLEVEESAKIVADETSFVSLVAIDGNAVINHGDSFLTLYKGESVFIPAGLGEVEILGAVTVIETRV